MSTGDGVGLNNRFKPQCSRDAPRFLTQPTILKVKHTVADSSQTFIVGYDD